MTVRSLPGAMLATVLCATAAFAVDDTAMPEPTTQGFKLLRDDARLSEEVDPMPALTAKAGDIDVKFEVTSLNDLQKAYGGEIAHFDGENRAIEWLCYALPASDGNPAMLVWFAADGMMSNNRGVNFLVAETAPAQATPTCAAPSKAFQLQLSVPGVGATPDDVAAAFKKAGDEKTNDGVLSYSGIVPTPPELKFPGEAATAASVGFQVEKSAITAVTMSQVSSS